MITWSFESKIMGNIVLDNNLKELKKLFPKSISHSVAWK